MANGHMRAAAAAAVRRRSLCHGLSFPNGAGVLPEHSKLIPIETALATYG